VVLLLHRAEPPRPCRCPAVKRRSRTRRAKAGDFELHRRADLRAFVLGRGRDRKGHLVTGTICTHFVSTMCTTNFFCLNPLHNYITWVWAEHRTSYRCSAKIFYLFPIYVIFVRDFKLTGLAMNFCTE
jgi:hypothetical protein